MSERDDALVIVVFVALLFLPGVTAPVAADATANAASIAEQGSALRENATREELPLWLRPKAIPEDDIDVIQARSRRLVDEAMGQAVGQARIAGLALPGRRVEMFVSLSLGDAVLREIFQEASGRSDVTVIFRGVPEGESITAGIRRIHSMLKKLDPVPNVVIDPRKFRERQVAAVPEVVLVSNATVIARAKGITGIDAFLRRVDSGKRGDMGLLGPTHAVIEPDLIEVMKKRLTALELRQKAGKAMQDYLSKADFVQIPPVTEERVRQIDPSIYVAHDITDASGRVLTAAGTKINPLDKVPFNARIVVFDATQEWQRGIARTLVRDAKSKAILLATRLDREAGWRGLRQLEEELRAPVYLLTPEVRDRFQIERTVSVIEARGRVFEVREVPAPRSRQD